MEGVVQKSTPKKIQKKDRLTWTEPLFPTGETPSPKTNAFGKYLKGDLKKKDFSDLYDNLQ
jgi:hypothetical protein